MSKRKKATGDLPVAFSKVRMCFHLRYLNLEDACGILPANSQNISGKSSQNSLDFQILPVIRFPESIKKYVSADQQPEVCDNN